MKNVLFITYYWPPSGKASIHWPLKIIKYLPEFNWQPSVITAKEDLFSYKDESLFKEISPSLKVIKTSSTEPFELYKKFLGKSKNEVLVASETISRENKSLAHRASIWIRMNLFVPDARAGWYPHAVSDGTSFIKTYPQDAIVTIGPPHTAHLIGMRLSKKFNIPHIPVFIDPWTDIVYYTGFKRSKVTRTIDNYLEKKVLQNAASVIFVTKSMQQDYINKYSFVSEKSHVLYWGYNEEDFEGLGSPPAKSEEEVIVHAGNIFDYQNPENFWKELKSRIDSGSKIKLKFIGSVSGGIKQAIENSGLQSSTEYAGFLPYKEMLSELLKADYLLVCATEKRHVPGKLFEYVRTGKTIIAFGEDNEEVKNILKETNAGMMFSYSEGGKEILNKTGKFNTNLSEVKKFDRRNITKEMAGIMNSLLKPG